MSDDPPANVLMTRAASGDKQGWDALVERYAPLIWSICRWYQLSSADAADIGQAIWPQFMDQLGKVRDLAALTGWLAIHPDPSGMPEDPARRTRTSGCRGRHWPPRPSRMTRPGMPSRNCCWPSCTRRCARR